VNSSRAFRLFIPLLLLVSVGWKIVIRPDNGDYLKTHLVDFFERNRFDVEVTKEIVNYTPIIRASRTSCRLQIARLTPDGSNRDLIHHLAGNADGAFVVFRGRVYERQPILFTVINYLWSRFLREMGLAAHIYPVIAVAQSSSCNAEQLPWSQLQVFR
jgi:hypothetical protein